MNQPLAERLRPQSLDSYIGQKHLVGEKSILRRMIENGSISSLIFWGPPGVGKTSLARIISNTLNRPFYTLSAISSGVKDVREAIERAEKTKFFNTPNPILFIDEIHRFSKAQQDSLLGAVEQGIVTLMGATTENPSFEVIAPLLSRCQVYVLKSLDEQDLKALADYAILHDVELKKKQINIQSYDALIRFSGGDARKLLNILELVINAENSITNQSIIISNENVIEHLQAHPTAYDKQGEMHYDIVSALIKSIRGSDADAAIYWLARMVEGGEDPKFIARRLIISAVEDVGLANPNALLLTNACFDAISKIGWPEARLVLAETVIYLANSPKSNSSYLAMKAAQREVQTSGSLEVPLHLRNAPTALMKKLNYGVDYKYPHDYPHNYVEQDYLPQKLQGKQYYKWQNNASEAQSIERQLQIKGKK